MMSNRVAVRLSEDGAYAIADRGFDEVVDAVVFDF